MGGEKWCTCGRKTRHFESVENFEISREGVRELQWRTASLSTYFRFKQTVLLDQQGWEELVTVVASDSPTNQLQSVIRLDLELWRN